MSITKKLEKPWKSNTLIAKYRKYLGSNGKRYIVLGFQATGDYSGQGINSEFQNLLHDLRIPQSV